MKYNNSSAKPPSGREMLHFLQQYWFLDWYSEENVVFRAGFYFTKSSKIAPHSPTVWGYFTYTAAALHSVYVNLQVSKYSSPIVVKKVVKK
ncbi:hypothetical protein GC101_19390 [Paenibacillus sp. LMG 31459]|uniref:Uncharacterized protein n=1 Tax=Paenibacillus phytohabitans TaxID=2654978 RepID=A0ABX1YJ12_9BACL|nr:hypothetical protein [Paenibacillus phytohabitans]NOU81030.1 hypothetical protein [Paenibacillus phytohabitans]